MLKPIPNFRDYRQVSQPPSGGCVLKLRVEIAAREVLEPAAFRRLCVETADWKTSPMRVSPAAFRRLCVETPSQSVLIWRSPPAAFRRLCVETITETHARSTRLTQPPSGGCVLKHVFFVVGDWGVRPSRLQAAVC